MRNGDPQTRGLPIPSCGIENESQYHLELNENESQNQQYLNENESQLDNF